MPNERMIKLYSEIAKQFGVTLQDVERELIELIDEVYHKPDKTEEEKLFLSNIQKTGSSPNVEEFLFALVKYISNNSK